MGVTTDNTLLYALLAVSCSPSTTNHLEYQNMQTTIKAQITAITSSLSSVTTYHAEFNPYSASQLLCLAIVQIYELDGVEWSDLPYEAQRSLMNATHELLGIQNAEDIIFKIEHIFAWMDDECLNRWDYGNGCNSKGLFAPEELISRFFIKHDVKRAA